MRNNIQTSFSIKDLENLSGIKAHTIRIWEKRYKLLAPKRSDTNIRTYDVDNLKRLLNVAYLNNSGIKISKIGNLTEEEIATEVQNLIISNDYNEYAHSMFKLSMMNFDKVLFDNTYQKLMQENTFRDIFLNIFVKLLDEIGLLWQTNTILPSHEHFISNLIRHKVLINTEKIQNFEKSSSKTFILFLPLNEIHELGLLFINFELTLKGYNSIFLGQSVPIDDLTIILDTFESTEFVSSFTVEPKLEHMSKYLSEFDSKILSSRSEKLHILGRNTTEYRNEHKNIIRHKNIKDLITSIL